MTEQHNSIKVGPEVSQLALNEDFFLGLKAAELLHKRELLGQFFTNLDGRVTALTNRMPSVLAAAVTARLSRAQIQDIRELFWQEFVQDPDLGLGDLISKESDSQTIESLLRSEKAGKMITRIIDKFGDDSVREQASGYVMVQDSSVYASMDAFRRGILTTGIEGSTRFIPYNTKDGSGKYRYVDAPPSFSKEDKDKYHAHMDRGFDLYSRLYPEVWAYVEKTNPRAKDVAEPAYHTAVLGKVCDLLRGLLPMGIKTNFAVHGNYRSLSDLIMSLRSSPLQESREMANLMVNELMKVSPEFIQMVDSKHGQRGQLYLSEVDGIQVDFVNRLGVPAADNGAPSVDVSILNADYMGDILQTIVRQYQPDVDLGSLQQVIDYEVKEENIERLMRFIKESRGNRRHKLPQAFGAGMMLVRFNNISLGAEKDFNRHRALSMKSEIKIDVDRGANIPEELKLVNGGEAYTACTEFQNQAIQTFFDLRDRYPEEAHLVLTHGTLGTMHMLMDIREAYWITEIRSMASGNPEYRWFAQEFYRKLIQEAPELAALDSHVDHTPTYALGRIGEAVRADLKGKS